MLLRAVLPLILCSGCVVANVEKIIFTAPRQCDTTSIASFFQLDTLSRHKHSLRKHLEVAFPTPSNPRGLQSWVLLDDLTPDRRYEVRICWVATQPTVFLLQAHTLDKVVQNSTLFSSFSEFNEAFQANNGPGEGQERNERDIISGVTRTTLLLQIFAAADFFTTNQSLMSFPPPVHVDIILDPYILNIFPESLLPTAAYVILIAVGSWYLSDYIWKWLLDLCRETEETNDSSNTNTEKQHAE